MLEPFGKIRLMRVVAVADKLSSGWYRVLQPAQALQGELDFYHAKSGLRVEHDGSRIKHVGAFGADVVLLLRPMYWFMPQVIERLQEQGVKVVVDVDDDFHAIYPGNRGFVENHPKVSPQSNWRFFRECVKRADLVTCSTPALQQRYGAHGRTALLRNCVTDSWLGIPNMSDGRTVGWAGAMSNHPNDPQATHGGVAMAVEDCGARFMCVGGGAFLDEVRKQLGFTSRIEGTEWQELELHPYLVARLSVGIVPLADTKFNDAKSYLKGIEYAALGIPFVASPVAEYRYLHEEHGLGLLAGGRARSWRRCVKALLTDRDLRSELAERGREIIRERHLISKNAWRWAEAWESTLKEGRLASHAV